MNPLQSHACAGESYAGVYVPTVVDEVLKGNAQGQHPKLNLQASDGRLAQPLTPPICQLNWCNLLVVVKYLTHCRAT